MSKSKFINIFLVIATGYLIITSALFMQRVTSTTEWQNLRFFIPNPEVAKELKQTEVQGSLPKVMLNRLFHNQGLSYWHIYWVNIYRETDPVFVFSLSNLSSMYSNEKNTWLMYPWEILLFITSLLITINTWSKHKKKYIVLLSLYLTALLISGLFEPTLSQIKLFPVVFLIRIWFCFAIYALLKKYLWAKK